MKSRFSLVVFTFLSVVLFTSDVAFAQTNDHAQNNAAVLVTGTFRSDFAPKFGGSDLQSFSLKTGINPGGEIVFKPRSRVSFGAGFSTLKFERQSVHHVVLRDAFQYLDAEGNLVLVEMPGVELASTDRTARVSDMKKLTGTLYYNFGKDDSRVRPFLGFRGGVGLAKIVQNYQTYLHPEFARLRPDFQFDLPSVTTDVKTFLLGGIGGVNFYPTKHLVIRTAAGYLNGGFAEAGIGFTF
ncbi:MAG: hypothetical protein Q7S09_01700 [bacterium]|nr:hypothetical protein [bacterium]